MRILVFFAIFLLLNGCESDNAQISQGGNISQEQIQQADNLDKNSYAGLEDVFNDTSIIDIKPDKQTLIIFGKNNCTYCEKLKDDIKQQDSLKELLQTHFNTYYVNVSYTKPHNLHFSTDSKLDSQELIEHYVKSPLRPTPTMVFVNEDGKSIFEIPGYLPLDSMIQVLSFIAQNKNDSNLSQKITQLN